MRQLPAAAALFGFLLLLTTASPISADPLDYEIPGGHFYTQANGSGGADGTGYAVVDDAVAPFWTYYQRYGGVAVLGYPISQRYEADGFVEQAFQKAILQWQPGRGMFFVNVFDRLSGAGLDDWLEVVRATPPSFDHAADAGQIWEAVVARHLALLEVNPAIKARYLADSDPIQHYGLPMSWKDYGNVFVVRAQRAVFQQWQTDTPWAKAGEVVIANGGDLAKEAGFLSEAATVPEPARVANQPATAGGCELPASAVSFDQFEPSPDGNAIGRGVIRNGCDQPVDVMIDVTARAGDKGRPLMDAPTIFAPNVPANGSRAVTTIVPLSAAAPSFNWSFSSVGVQAPDRECFDVGTTRCLQADPALRSTIDQLRSHERGNWLVRVAAEHGVRITKDETGLGILGQYRPSNKTITIDRRLDRYSSWVRATILAHELQHAADDAAGLLGNTSAACFRTEEVSFRRQAEIWTHFWQGQFPPEVDAIHAELNGIAITVAEDPGSFIEVLITKYHDECGG